MPGQCWPTRLERQEQVSQDSSVQEFDWDWCCSGRSEEADSCGLFLEYPCGVVFGTATPASQLGLLCVSDTLRNTFTVPPKGG